MPKLVLIPTPIGNLEDITLRAINTLKEVDFLLAEDTRVSGKLLKHLNISKPIRSYHSANEHKVVERLAEEISTKNLVGLVTDAGTPAISDPGFLLVRECLKLDVEVECLPGATAFVPALAASGLASESFVFEGFLPHKKGRHKKLSQLKSIGKTIVLYESPYRVQKLLTELEEHFGEVHEVVAAREISKLFEEFVRGPVKEVKQHFEEHPPKGEFVVIVAPFVEQ